MSHSAAAPAPAPAPAPPQGQAVYAGDVPQPKPAPAYVDTPSLLNRWQLIGMSVAVIFGLISAIVQFTSWQADGRAADDTEQLVRVQEVQSSLLRADALATNAFLVGGLEDPAKRAEYDEAITSVLKNITDAAEAQPADREALAALNVETLQYATAVAQARDNNRLGYPIGAEYLTGASNELRAEALPILSNLVDANTERAEGAMAAQHPFWLLLIGVLALVVLVWLNRQLAQLFRRRINKGLAVAGAVVLAFTLVSAVLALARDDSNDGLREEEFATAVAESNVRTAANDAKASESLRLIKRGSGAAYHDAWLASAKVVDENAGPDTQVLWEAYVDDYERIDAYDDDGEWSSARNLATSADGSTATLDAVDAQAKEIVTENAETATDDLRSGRGLALALSALTLLGGVAAAIAVARGIGERRREFA